MIELLYTTHQIKDMKSKEKNYFIYYLYQIQYLLHFLRN